MTRDAPSQGFYHASFSTFYGESTQPNTIFLWYPPLLSHHSVFFVSTKISITEVEQLENAFPIFNISSFFQETCQTYWVAIDSELSKQFFVMYNITYTAKGKGRHFLSQEIEITCHCNIVANYCFQVLLVSLFKMATGKTKYSGASNQMPSPLDFQFGSLD